MKRIFTSKPAQVYTFRE